MKRTDSLTIRTSILSLTEYDWTRLRSIIGGANQYTGTPADFAARVSTDPGMVVGIPTDAEREFLQAVRALPGQVEAFFAVSTDRIGNANGCLNSAGCIAAERAASVLSTDRTKAQAAVDAYQKRDPKHRAKVGTTWCFPEWLGKAA